MSRTPVPIFDRYVCVEALEQRESGRQPTLEEALFALVEDVRMLRKRVKRLEKSLKDSQSSQGCGGR